MNTPQSPYIVLRTWFFCFVVWMNIGFWVHGTFDGASFNAVIVTRPRSNDSCKIYYIPSSTVKTQPTRVFFFTPNMIYVVYRRL